MNRRTRRTKLNRRTQNTHLIALRDAITSRSSFPAYGSPITALGFVRAWVPTYRGRISPYSDRMTVQAPLLNNLDLATSRVAYERAVRS